jgi:hypothetical protein
MWCQYFVVKSNLVLFATRHSLQAKCRSHRPPERKHFNAVYGHRARAEDFMSSRLRNQKSAGRFSAQGRSPTPGASLRPPAWELRTARSSPAFGRLSARDGGCSAASGACLSGLGICAGSLTRDTRTPGHRKICCAFWQRAGYSQRGPSARGFSPPHPLPGGCAQFHSRDIKEWISRSIAGKAASTEALPISGMCQYSTRSAHPRNRCSRHARCSASSMAMIRSARARS